MGMIDEEAHIGVFLVYLQMRSFGHILSLLDPHQARLVTFGLQFLLHYLESYLVSSGLCSRSPFLPGLHHTARHVLGSALRPYEQHRPYLS